MKYPYNIIEVANTHGGNEDYLHSLIEEFTDIKGNVGIKFQPFHYDGIALKDYEWYPTYQTLHFNEDSWKNSIEKAAATKDVWLDIFDIYGVKILQLNSEKVKGLKLQTSVLENFEVLDALAKTDLSKMFMIINIAGRSLEEIAGFIDYCETHIKPKELLLEVGFQSYPTEFMDSGLGKIKNIKQQFNKKIVFADHIDGKLDDAILLPLMALIEGADVIEKHVMHSVLETKFDAFSSITKDKFDLLLLNQNKYSEAIRQPFINEREEAYFKKTIQVPVLNKNKKKGEQLRASDLAYRRTGQSGMTYDLIKPMLNGRFVMNEDAEAYATLKENSVKKVKIATIIAARLKSTRLKDKARLKIGDLSSIELCIKNALKFKDVDYTILATSTLEQDDELKNYTYSKDVIFHKGDPDDVIQRYLDIIRKLNIDVVIRVTGDNAFISADIAEVLLKSHFETGADYTVAKSAPIGINLEIINTSALEKVKRHFTKADYSEYMTWYFQNNPEHFKLNFVDLPEKWIRNYRLTLDYPEDLEMYNHIERYFKEKNIDYSVDELISFLDKNPEVAKINANLEVKFLTDQSLIDTLNKVTKIN